MTIPLIDAPFMEDGLVEAEAMDRWLDNLQSLLTAIAQRRMTDGQLERLAILLNEGQSGALARAKPRRLSA